MNSCVRDALPYSYLTDSEFLGLLLAKRDLTVEESEAALRIELLLNSYASMLEQIHATAVGGIQRGEHEALYVIRDITAPVIRRFIQ